MHIDYVPNTVEEWLVKNRLFPESIYSRNNSVLCVFPKSVIELKLSDDRVQIRSVKYSPQTLPY